MSFCRRVYSLSHLPGKVIYYIVYLVSTCKNFISQGDFEKWNSEKVLSTYSWFWCNGTGLDNESSDNLKFNVHLSEMCFTSHDLEKLAKDFFIHFYGYDYENSTQEYNLRQISVRGKEHPVEIINFNYFVTELLNKTLLFNTEIVHYCCGFDQSTLMMQIQKETRGTRNTSLQQYYKVGLNKSKCQNFRSVKNVQLAACRIAIFPN